MSWLNSTNTKNIKTLYFLKLLVYLFIFALLFSLVFNILNLIIEINSVDYNIVYNMNPSSVPGSSSSSSSSSSVPPVALSDPVRYWPSGVPQSASIIASGVGVYMALTKLGGLSPRVRGLFAVGATGVSASVVTVQTILENPIGFSRFITGYFMLKNNGHWPSWEEMANVYNTTPKDTLTDEAKEFLAIRAEVKKTVSSGNVEGPAQRAALEAWEAWKDKGGKEFIGSALRNNNDFNFTDFFMGLYESLFKLFIAALRALRAEGVKPGIVEGHLDDLIGQRLFLEFILFLTIIFVVILFILFLFNLLIVLNKDRLNSLFNNKFTALRAINFILKYEIFVSRVLLFIIPIFIFIGLFLIGYVLLWLISNPIPYDKLGIDLHQFISSKYK